MRRITLTRVVREGRMSGGKYLRPSAFLELRPIGRALRALSQREVYNPSASRNPTPFLRRSHAAKNRGKIASVCHSGNGVDGGRSGADQRNEESPRGATEGHRSGRVRL